MTFIPPASQRLFNFLQQNSGGGSVLQRYRWRAEDFGDLQDNGIVAIVRSALSQLSGAAVVAGLGYSSATGLNFTASSGVAFGPSGEVMVVIAPATGTFTSPVGNPCRSLVVIRPNLITPASGVITDPTVPLVTVPLFFDHYAQVVVVNGTAAAQPAYPSLQPNDAVLFGVRLASGATGFASTDVDYEIRDFIGKNSLLQHHIGKSDTRLQSYRSSNQLAGVKPSQTTGTVPKLFTYISRNVASLFPRTSGVFVAADTYLNFQTGALTGGDTTSPSFSPSIPTAGNSIVALVSLSASDTLSVSFGTIGTYAQCATALTNQAMGGAGAIPTPPSQALSVCWVILSSLDGVNISDLDVIDARSIFQLGGISSSGVGISGNGVAVQQSGTFNLASSFAGQVIPLAGGTTVNLPNPSTVTGIPFTFLDETGAFSANPAVLHRNSTESIFNVASDYTMNAPGGSWSIVSDGTNWQRVS